MRGTVPPQRHFSELGVGLLRKSFAIVDIPTVRRVRNCCFDGWGIKLPHSWLYNVSGFDVVEIQLKSSRKYGVGADQPEALHRFSEAVLVSVQASVPGPLPVVYFSTLRVELKYAIALL